MSTGGADGGGADPRAWLVTGGSSGIGRALAEEVIRRGGVAVATFRKPDQLAEYEARAPGRAIGCLLDVTDRDAIGGALDTAIGRAGRIDVVVNNAGYGLQGAVEEVTDEEIRHQLETNYFGPLGVIRAVLPRLRAQGRGHIFNVSSTAGFIGFPGLGIYASSKFALEGLSEALRKELAPFGIKVTIVEPGGFRTRWAGDSMTWASGRIPEYAETVGAGADALHQRDGTQPGDPRRAALAILACADADDPPLRLVLGTDCLANIRGHLAAVATELDQWEHLSATTAFR